MGTQKRIYTEEERLPSSHVTRRQSRRPDDDLDTDLYNFYLAKGFACSGIQSCLKNLQKPNKKKTYTKYKTLAYIQALKDMWKATPKTSYFMTGSIPKTGGFTESLDEQKLNVAIQRLKPPQRQVIEQVYRDLMTWRDVFIRYKTAERTFYDRIRRAKKNIQKTLQNMQ